MSDLQPAAREALEVATAAAGRAGNGEEVEAFVQDLTQTDVTVYAGRVESLKSARTRGLGVRVVSQGRLGYAWSADLSDEAVRKTVEDARANAAVATPDEANALPRPAKGKEDLPIFDPSAPEVPADRKVGIALDLEARVLKGDDRIRSVESTDYADFIGHVAVASTAGIGVAWSQSACWCVTRAIAGDGDESQSGFGLSIARHPENLDLDEAAADAVLRSTRLLGAKKVPTAKVPAVFDPQATAALLQVLAAAASAEQVVKGRSLFIGKIGEPIGSEHLTIVDDGTLPDGVYTSPYDAEGVPTSRTSIVENGTLRSYLHNAWSALRMGVASTGNARRPSFRSTPGIAPTNFVVTPGKRGQEELVGSLDDGFYVQDLMGIHSGVNPISGDFSVGATGLWIKGGSFGQPVREVTVASTVFDLLKGVIELGSDVKVLPFGAGYAAPSVVIGEVTVAGA